MLGNTSNRTEQNSETARVSDFVEFLGQHQLSLFRYVLAMVPSLQDAEDVMQEVSRVLWQRFDDFAPGTSFLAWARRIAYFRILEFRRAKDRRLQILPEDLLQAIAEQTMASDALDHDRREALAHCFEEMRPTDRTIINARYTPGVTITDLAKHLGRPVNSVYKSLGRIRQSLLACIERRIGNL